MVPTPGSSWTKVESVLAAREIGTPCQTWGNSMQAFDSTAECRRRSQERWLLLRPCWALKSKTNMTAHLLTFIIAACLAISGCKANHSAVPLTIEALQRLTSENTSAIAFRERGGDILVSVTDAHGDRHEHRLVLGSTSKEDAIRLLHQRTHAVKGGVR